MKIIVIGKGPQARMVMDIIIKQGHKCYQADYHTDVKEIECNNVVIAAGDNYTRYKIYNELIAEKLKLNFLNVIADSAIVMSDNIGIGNLIMPNTVIQSDAKIGNFCLLSANSVFGHNGIMEDFSSISAGVIVGGRGHIMEGAAVAIGSTVFADTELGEWSVVGAGSVVTKNISRYELHYGNPAKFVRVLKSGYKYLK